MAMLFKIAKDNGFYKQCVLEIFQDATKGHRKAIVLTWYLGAHGHKIDP